MTKIYEQHEKAFSNVSAYVILKDGERVATVAFKYPNDGAGRLWCYLHVLGLPMVRAYAGGYGYDKASAAFTSAAQAQTKVAQPEYMSAEQYKRLMTDAAIIHDACKARDGYDWQRNIADAGFIVLKAV